jgi:uncharacterized protein
MRPRRHVVVFAKAPRVGRVKKRLSAGIGALPALRFYRLTTERLLRRLAGDPRWRCWLALTPDRAAAGPRDWRIRVERMPQGPGDLGRRMAHAFRRLPPGPALIVGSDIPAMTTSHVAGAFRLLGGHDVVLGPARDGGYWLIGLRRRPLPYGLFAGVRWSTEHALADTLASLPRRLSIGSAAMLDDVDDGAALRKISSAKRRPPPNPSPLG